MFVLVYLFISASLASTQDYGQNVTTGFPELNDTEVSDDGDPATSEEPEDTSVQNTELELIGEQKNLPYSPFPGIKPELRPTLQRIDLERFELEPTKFIDALRECNELEYIYLNDVYWQGQFTTKLELSNLKRFVLHQKNWDAKKSTAESFMSTLFFYTNQSNVKIDVNRALTLEPADSKLQLSHLPYDISHLFRYTKLILRKTVLKVQMLNEVTQLKLDDVELIGGGIDEILEKCAATEKLTFKLATTYTMNLAKLPTEYLKELSISNMIFSNSAQNPIQFEALKSLELSSCEFNLSQFVFPESLNILTLQNVTIQQGNISAIIQKYKNIKELALANMTVIDMAELEQSEARAFKFANSYLTNNLETTSEFKNIFSLSINQCIYDELFIKKFSLLFKNMKRFTIKGDFNALLLVKEVFNTSATALMFHLEGSEKLLVKPELQEGLQILANLSVPPGETQFSLYKWQNGSGWDVVSGGRSVTQNRDLRDAMILLYVLPIALLALIGIFGNVLSGWVLSRKRLRSSTSCILLGLTLSDLLLLVTYFMSVTYFGLKLILIFLQFQITDAEYPFLWFAISVEDAQKMEYLQSHFLYSISKTAYTSSVYCTILVTLERYIAVCWPLKARRFLHIQRSTVATMCVLMFSILLNGPRWLEGQVPVVVEQEKNSRGSRNWRYYRDTSDATLLSYTNYRLIYHGFIWITLMYVLPIGLLIVLNFKIRSQLRASKACRASMSAQNKKSEDEQAALTRMLLCIISLFVACNLVNGVVVWGFLWYGDWDRWEPSDIEVFSCLPLIINSSANFIIYFLMGHKFRRELIKMFPKCIRARFASSSRPGNTYASSSRPTESTMM